MTPADPARPRWEVADAIRLHGEAFLRKHGGHLSGTQKKALRDLARCRTAALGGHVSRCLDCDRDRIAYNSCRNRHCPKCGALARARWLEKEAAHLLPVEYFHVVFTLPSEVAELAEANPAPLYEALFRAAAATLREVAANPKRLGAQVGALMVLHTWGQNLHHHPHVHAVVTGGGPSCDARGAVDADPTWKACRPGFFLPVRVLSRVFRRLYLAQLQQLFEAGRLAFRGRSEALADPRAFAARLASLRAREWVVYAKPPFGGPERVLKYLARYTHRVALSNARLASVDGDGVRFQYKDYADAGRTKAMTLSGTEFLRRFALHVLPPGFVRIRHTGLLAHRDRDERLALCRRLLAAEAERAVLTGAEEPGAAAATAPAGSIAPAAEPCCPHCGGRRLIRLNLPHAPNPDTS